MDDNIRDKPIRWILKGDETKSKSMIGQAKNVLLQLKNIQGAGSDQFMLKKKYTDGSLINVRTNVQGLDIILIDTPAAAEKVITKKKEYFYAVAYMVEGGVVIADLKLQPQFFIENDKFNAMVKNADLSMERAYSYKYNSQITTETSNYPVIDKKLPSFYKNIITHTMRLGTEGTYIVDVTGTEITIYSNTGYVLDGQACIGYLWETTRDNSKIYTDFVELDEWEEGKDSDLFTAVYVKFNGEKSHEIDPKHVLDGDLTDPGNYAWDSSSETIVDYVYDVYFVSTKELNLQVINDSNLNKESWGNGDRQIFDTLNLKLGEMVVTGKGNTVVTWADPPFCSANHEIITSETHTGLNRPQFTHNWFTTLGYNVRDIKAFENEILEYENDVIVGKMGESLSIPKEEAYEVITYYGKLDYRNCTSKANKCDNPNAPEYSETITSSKYRYGLLFGNRNYDSKHFAVEVDQVKVNNVWTHYIMGYKALGGMRIYLLPEPYKTEYE